MVVALSLLLGYQFGKEIISEKGWYKITFKQPFKDIPKVLVTGEYREGWYKPDYYSPKNVSIPNVKITIPQISISLPKVKIEIPAFSIPQLPSLDLAKFRDSWFEKARKSIDDAIQIPFPFDFLDDPIAYAGGLAAWFAAWLAGSLYLDQIRPIVNDGLTKLNTAIKNTLSSTEANLNNSIENIRSVIETEINSALENIRLNIETAINNTINNFIDNLSSNFNSISAEISEALNKSIDKLWDMIGMAKGILFTPIPIRNITPLGFEVYSVGKVTINWIAYTDPDPQFLEAIQKAGEIGEKLVEYENTIKNLTEWIKSLTLTLKSEGIKYPVLPQFI